MTCQKTQDLIHGYIDGELDLLKNIEIERHMDECESCSLARKQQLALRSAIRDSSLYFDAPELLKKRVKNTVRAASKAEANQRIIPRRWLAVAASLAIIALCGFLIWTFVSNRSRSGGDDLLAQEVVYY